MELIECAFETKVVVNKSGTLLFSDAYNGWQQTELAQKAIKFGERYITDDGRLKGIMNNIIKNGSFKPGTYILTKNS